MAFFWRHATAMVALVGASSVPHLITNRIFCKQSDAQDTKCKESLGTDATNDKESTSGVVVVKKNPKCPRIVVLGSGWGAMTFVKNLQVKACEVGSNHTGKQNEFEVVVISPRNYFLMTPLLPQVTTGVLNARSIIVPFRRLMNSSLGKNAVFLEAECTSIDTTKQVIACRDSSPIQSSSDRFGVEYDYLVVAVGAENNTFNTPGVKENCFFLKEIRDSLKIRTSVIDLIETASLPSTSNEERKNLLHFVIVGGGPTGVEFAAELADLLHKDMSTLFPKVCNSNVKITLIQSADHILNCFDEAMSKFAEEQFKKEGVEIRLNTRVTEVGPNVITIVDKMTKKKEEIHFGLCLWATGISPRPLIKDLIQALPGQTKKNALATDQNLRVIGVPQQNVYALGDCATVVGAQTVNKVVEMFNSYDSNKDGQLDQDEFDAFLDVTMKKYPQIRLLLEKSRSILSGKKTMALFSAFDKASISLVK
eukprot:TRINITY_DN2440_c0_g1_i2.p1 TRINITY_DN2440_c0_g1~~TRINITY_DN2440_c0_g1_i2.p1  ORF type:complete len:479 (-),score=109.76 TRINITY_DN2440_c0_g1_i2:172-1608(-)